MKLAYGVHVVKHAAVVMIALRNFRSVHRSFEPSSHSHLLLSQGLVSAQAFFIRSLIQLGITP